MICPKCKKAGQKMVEQLFTRAEQLHLMCEWPASCGCQHKLTSNYSKEEDNEG